MLCHPRRSGQGAEGLLHDHLHQAHQAGDLRRRSSQLRRQLQQGLLTVA